ncbi:MAG: hypothetical protein GY929_00620 [Actinomycetia bacterium]|nr:hypothetical protein [Actinomycetes bacterium]
MTESDTAPPRVTLLTGTGLSGGLVGGKAQALDRLVGLGVPVPASGVITARAYREFVEAPALRALLDELGDNPVAAPAEHAAERARVDEAFLAVPIPAPLAADITELALDVGAGGLVAVRSSATAEDLAGASFAGQYRSFLGVAPDEIAAAVRLTWASLWHPAPRVYRRFRALDEDDLAMAVILMAMLNPSEAGVLFTTDPGGAEDALRLELVTGLGEALVSGAATPEVTVMARGSAAAELATRSRPLADLARLALEVETALGAPQDIEWAIDSDRLFFLQSRPITTVGALERPADSLDTLPRPTATYTSAGIAEMVPGLLPPRLWELNSWALEEGFRRLFDRLGATTTTLDEPHALLARFRGRAALDLDRMKEAVRSVPGGSSAELEREYLGRAVEAEPSPTPSARGPGTYQAVRVARARLSSAQDAASMSRTAERLVEAEPSLEELSDIELLAYRARLVQLAGRTMAAEVAVAAMATAAYRGVERKLAHHVEPAEVATMARRATRGDSTDSTLTATLDELGDRLRTSSTAVAAADEDWSVAEPHLLQSVEGRAIHLDFGIALHRAGSMAVCGGTPWSESAPTAWRAVVMQRHQPDPTDRGDDPELPGGRWLRREAGAAAELLARRQRAKAAVMTVGGLIWRADRQLADRLVAGGRLEAVDDVDLLLGSELRLLCSDGGPTLADIALRRRRIDEQALDGPLPRVFRGQPTVAHQQAAMAERFTGWGASAGRFRGPARIVRSAAGGGLQRGEVLVAQRTDASWAPLFLIAGAIVVEEGGPLSHTAIVSRELGLPAVINIPGIVERIDREVSTVALSIDGTTGEVLVHRGGGPSPPEPDAAPDAPQPGVAVTPPSSPPGGPQIGRLGVFVSGLIGAGAVLSGLMTISQALSGRRAQQRIRARAEVISAELAEGVISGYGALGSSVLGLHPRPFYARMAIALGFLAALLAGHGLSPPGATRWTPLWRAADFSAAAELSVVAVVLAVAAARWPMVPPVIRRLPPPSGTVRPSVVEVVGRPGLTIVGSALGLVALLAVIVHTSERSVGRIDEWIYDRLGAGTDADRWGPEWIDVLGSSEVMIPVALFVAVAVIRCRPLAYAIPTTIALAGTFHLGLGQLVPRDRPPLGESAGHIDSFPGGFVLEVTLVLGFLPLALAVLTGRRARWSWLIVGILWIILVIDAVRLGAHWPSDNLAGLATGVAFLVVVHTVARAPALHLRCRGCPAQQRPSQTVPPQEVLERNH